MHLSARKGQSGEKNKKNDKKNKVSIENKHLAFKKKTPESW